MSSKTFIFLVTTIAMVVQMHFPNTSPLEKHSSNLWIFMVCLFLHAFASTYCKAHASASTSTSNNIDETPYIKLSSHIAQISGSMACVALLSVLIASKTGLALIIIIYFMCLPMYFAPDPVAQICKKIGSYVYDKWNKIKHNSDDARPNLPV